MRRYSILTAAALAVSVGSAAASSAEDVRAAIETANKAFSAAIAKGDAAAVAALYTSSAQAMPPGGEAAKGRDEIQKAFQGLLASGATNLTLTTQEVEAHGDTAHEVGSWTLKAKDGAAVDNGKYVVIWKKEAGQWRLHRDIWNSSATAPAK
jgi:uncharacterized protein (TIGR02246 family)